MQTTINWTPDSVRLVVAANAAGLRQDEIAGILGVSKYTIQRHVQASGHQFRGVNQYSRRSARTEEWAALLRRMAAGELPPAAPAQSRSARASDFGIRVHVNRNGVSLPYVPSIHDEVRA